MDFDSVESAMAALRGVGYLADRDLAVATFLADRLGKPLLLDGPAGVGKTALARAVSDASGRQLIRLQCYEGLDDSKALYEWAYGKQMLYTQLLRDALVDALDAGSQGPDGEARPEAGGVTEDPLDRIFNSVASREDRFFSERFLIARPLLAAIRSDTPTVLLIDEVDRSDPELEALLLEVLSDFQVTVPELGTLSATHKPFVILTSNGTRELTEALRRRCLHAFLDYPDAQREREIVQLKVPEASNELARQVVVAAQRARDLDLRKTPSVAEVIDWCAAIVALGRDSLTRETYLDTLTAIAKHREDLDALHTLPLDALYSHDE